MLDLQEGGLVGLLGDAVGGYGRGGEAEEGGGEHGGGFGDKHGLVLVAVLGGRGRGEKGTTMIV